MTAKPSSPKAVVGDPGLNGFPIETFGNDDQTARAALKAAEDVLSQVGFDNPELEARFLLSGLLRVPLTDFFVHPDRELDPTVVETFQKMVTRRCQREPVSYIVGWHQFMGNDFHVDPRVLIPRPETEILVERASEWLSARSLSAPKILDVGT